MSNRPVFYLLGAFVLSCKGRQPPAASVEPHPQPPAAVAPSRFDLSIESERGSSVFVFTFPDRRAQHAIISSLSVGKEGAPQVWCELDAIDLNGELIEERWTAGVVPKNYRASGCTSKVVTPGNYEVALFTQRGEFRRRLAVAADGRVRVLPWE